MMNKLMLLLFLGLGVYGRFLFQTTPGDESSCPLNSLENVVGKIMNVFYEDERKSCNAIVLSMRAILTSADCIFNRFGNSSDIAPYPFFNINQHLNLTFEIFDNREKTVVQKAIQSFLIPTEYQTNSSDQIAMANNFAVAFLQEELSEKFVEESNKYKLPEDASDCLASFSDTDTSIVGYFVEEILNVEQANQFAAFPCTFESDGCDQTCQVDRLTQPNEQFQNGSPILDCRGDDIILRGLYHTDQQVPLDPQKIKIIKQMLQASAASSPLLPIQNILPYTFTNDSVAYTIANDTIDDIPEKTDLVWWHIFVPIIATFVFLLFLILIIYLCFRYVHKLRRLISPVMLYDEETGRDVDLDIDIGKQIVEKIELGSGGFGIVYKGVWRPRAREVAYKTLRERRRIFGSDAEAMEKEKNEMRQELLFLSSVQHPNILRCYGGALEPQVALVMEFCKGGDLYNYVHYVQKDRLTAEECYSIGYDVASGLAFLHSRNLIHRDIKTKNILRVQKSTNEVGFVKIADFGLTRQIPDGETQQDTLRNMGTLEYMAPELQLNADGKVKFGRKVDIFALGVVLYECATGLMPWHDITEKETIMFKVCQGERMQIPEDVEPQLKNIIEDCWSASPDRRPEAEDLTKRFDQLLSMIGSSRGYQLAEQKERIMRHGSVFPESALSLPPIMENGNSGSPFNSGSLTDSLGATQDMS